MVLSERTDDAGRSQLVKDGHQLFAEWSPQEQKRLGLENLF